MFDNVVPTVSVLIVTYNSSATIRSCLDSVVRQLRDGDEAIVVDNGSSDDSRSILESYAPFVRCVASTNTGFGAGMNYARSFASGVRLFVLNPDTVLADGCIDELRALEPGPILYAPQQIDEKGRSIGAGRAADVFGFPVDQRSSAVFYADGAAIFLSTAFYDALGGFDEAGFLFCEDVDLSWRTWLCGGRVVPVDSAVVMHRMGASIIGGKEIAGRRVTSTLRRYYTEFNILRQMIRHYSVPYLLLLIPAYFMLLAIEIVVLLAVGQIPVVAALLRAVARNIRSLPITLRCRARVQAQRTVGDGAIVARLWKGSGKVQLFMRVGLPRFVR